MRSPTPTASASDTDEDPKGVQDNNSDELAPDREICDSSSSGDEARSLRLPHQGWCLREACFKEFKIINHPALLLHNLLCAEEWGQ
jgi:hypothetical protein